MYLKNLPCVHLIMFKRINNMNKNLLHRHKHKNHCRRLVYTFLEIIQNLWRSKKTIRICLTWNSMYTDCYCILVQRTHTHTFTQTHKKHTHSHTPLSTNTYIWVHSDTRKKRHVFKHIHTHIHLGGLTCLRACNTVWGRYSGGVSWWWAQTRRGSMIAAANKVTLIR